MKFLATVLFSLTALVGYSQQDTEQILQSLVDEKDSVVLQQKINELKNGPEENYSILLRYSNIKRNGQMMRDLEEEAIKKFPKGMYAFDKLQFKFYQEKDVAELEKLLAQARIEFPDKDFERIHTGMALAYLEQKDLKGASTYTEKLTSPFFVRMVAERMKGVDKSAAEALVKKHIDSRKEIKPDNGFYNLVSFYSAMMMESGNEREAFKYAEEAYKNLNRKDDLLIRNYATLLSKSGKNAEASAVLESAIAEGKINDTNKELLYQVYQKAYPKNDVNAYWKSVYAKFAEKVRSEVAKKMINQTAPAFVLRDAGGKEVSLNEFKGKTIVVDFWATWCVPCKKSFPAMNMALDKYRNDPNVKFLFVHTWERSETPLQDALNYLKESGFKFDLYMDAKNADKKNVVVTAFEVTGIPTKFVIDGNGKIRFKVLGFHGEDAAASEELMAMIEMARSASN
jgi:thiol-disulfide isomerase/thioredoxin